MTTNAKLYVTALLVLGLCVLTMNFAEWRLMDPVRFSAFFFFGCAASILKVAAPAMAGKMSVNFIFVLIGLTELPLPETLLVGCASVVIECIWRPGTRTTPLEVFFSIANMAVAISCANAALQHPAVVTVLPVELRIVLATTAFFIANSFPMSAVIALSTQSAVLRTWKDKNADSVPLYAVGAILACAFHAMARYTGWQTALLTLPVAYLLYRTYRLHIARAEDARVHAESLANLHLRTIEALALAIEAKDNTTHDHLRRVQVYAMAVGKDLGLDEDELEALRAAAVLHDIGKLAVPEYIISKPGRLSPEEFEKMKIHPVVGAEILEHVQFPYPVVPIVRAHHEKWNGTGYPFGLRGKDIPVGARILSAVDALDALASDRQYRRALPLDDAMGKIEQDSGKAFDPAVVEVLKRRYVELEKSAKQASGDTIKLSLDLKIRRGAAPAAGFEAAAAPVEFTSTEGEPLPFLEALALARADIQSVFESANAGAISIEELLSALAVRFKRLVPHDAFALYVVREDKLMPQYVTGDNYRLFSSLRIPVGQGLSGWVAENRKPILNGNPSVESGYLNNPSIFSTLRSAISVPLQGSASLIGVLSLYHEGRDAFTKDQLRLLQAIASKLALAIETAARANAGMEPMASDLPDAATSIRHLDTEFLRCRRLNTPLALILCSIDGLRQVQAERGRTETELLVRNLTQAMRDGIRDYDFLGRLGPNEFMLVLPGFSTFAVRAKASKLMQIASGSGAGAVSVLAADAICPDDGNDAEELLAAADRRLHQIRAQRQPLAKAAPQSAGRLWVMQ
jgi:putative nucleotidyltransferase with HDIG domain/diguanylate cyclase (GGDEF)-like protein